MKIEHKNLKFVRITNEMDLARFQQQTAQRIGVQFPMEYLQRSQVVALMDQNRQIWGGYALVMEGPFRVLSQIPESDDWFYRFAIDSVKTLEITGFWLDPTVTSRHLRLRLWLKIFSDLVLSGKKYFVYSYDASSPKLAKDYSICSPTLIYRGPVKALEGMKGTANECVEIGSVYKVIQAFLSRPDFLLKKFFVRRRLHLNNEFMEKVASF